MHSDSKAIKAYVAAYLNLLTPEKHYDRQI